MQFAHKSEVYAGTKLTFDEGSSCGIAGATLAARHGIDGRIFVPCAQGAHYLDAQEDEDGFYVGVYLTDQT